MTLTLRTLSASTFCAISLMLAGCATAPRPAAIAAAADYAPRQYQIFSGDKLTVVVYGEQQLTRDVDVGQDGKIDLALIGSVEAQGKTVSELRDQLAKAYGSGYLVNPRVTVEVKNYRPFSILGEVNKAGNYPYLPGLTIKGAIAAAEGYTYRADRREAWIKRREDGQYKVFGLDRDLEVMPGDVIEIPERSAL